MVTQSHDLQEGTAAPRLLGNGIERALPRLELGEGGGYLWSYRRLVYLTKSHSLQLDTGKIIMYPEV
jgi:hypothetical protein